MNIQQTPIEESPDGYEPEPDDAWLEETEELPPRPRRKLLAPVPIALFVVLLLALAFFAGVEVQKSQGGSQTASGVPSGFAALRSAARAASSTGASAGGASPFAGGAASGGGFPGVGGLGGGLTSGEVSYVDGTTLYVTTREGATVKVTSPAGTKVSKTVSTSVKSIHPGDTVVVRGSQAKNGSVTAGSISVNSNAAGTGTGAASSATGTAAGSGSGGSSSQQLFGG